MLLDEQSEKYYFAGKCNDTDDGMQVYDITHWDDSNYGKYAGIPSNDKNIEILGTNKFLKLIGNEPRPNIIEYCAKNKKYNIIWAYDSEGIHWFYNTTGNYIFESQSKNKINETYILNEKFSMDNWKKKDYDKIIDAIINEENPNLDAEVAYSYEIGLLNLPQEVKDAILHDYITREKPKQDAISASYQTPEQIESNKKYKTGWDDIDAWYVMEHPYARKYIEKYCMNEFKKTYNFIESLGNPMTLYRYVNFDYNKYRGIKQQPTSLPPSVFGSQILRLKGRHLGLCWTPHWEKAEEFGLVMTDHNRHCMIIEARVPRDAVNLPNTLMKRSQLTYFNYEDEIELIKGSRIWVEAFHVFDEDSGTFKELGGRDYYKA